MQAKQHLRFLLFVFTMALLYTGSIFVPGCTALASSSVSHARYGYTLELPNGWTPLWQEDADFQQARITLPDGTLTSAEALGFTMAARHQQGDLLLLRQIEMNEQTASTYVSQGASEPDLSFLRAIGMDASLGEPLYEMGSQRYPCGSYAQVIGYNASGGQTEIAYGYTQGRLMVLIHTYTGQHINNPIPYVLYSLQAQSPMVYFPTLQDCRWNAQLMDGQAWQTLIGVDLPVVTTTPVHTPIPQGNDKTGQAIMDGVINVIIYAVPIGILITLVIIGGRAWFRYCKQGKRLDTLLQELPPVMPHAKPEKESSAPHGHSTGHSQGPPSSIQAKAGANYPPQTATDAIPRACPQCGHPVGPKDRFCSRCGLCLQEDERLFRQL